MFKGAKAATFLSVFLLFVWMVSSANAGDDEPKVYLKNNVLAAGNYNQGTSSSDLTLIIQLEVGGDIVIDEEAEVKYIVPEEDAPGWTEVKFDDSKWEDGISGVGYSDGDDKTVVQGGIASIYTRYYFDVPNAKGVKNITLRAKYDDAYIVWLNGVEIGRTANITTLSPVGEVPAWDVSAVRGAMGGHEAEAFEAIEVDVEYGGQQPAAFPVESRGKLITTWGNLKAQL